MFFLKKYYLSAFYLLSQFCDIEKNEVVSK
jgi:hypothetical protein